MGKHSMQLRSTLLLFALVTHAYCAQSTPLAVDGVALHVVERDGSQSDKLLIQTRNQSLALDLNRSVGIRGSAHITPEGILIAGPYVLDTSLGKLLRQSSPGYMAVSRQLDAHVDGRRIYFKDGARHWQCHLPLPPINPYGIALQQDDFKAHTPQRLLVFGVQRDTESGITAIRPITLMLPGCRIQQARAPLDFEHGMVVPQASLGGWWAYSISEPKLALSKDGISWRYPSLPTNVRSLLSAFLDDNGVTWIAVSLTGNDDAIQLLRQTARSKEWQLVQQDETALPHGWLEGRLLLASNPRP